MAAFNRDVLIADGDKLGKAIDAIKASGKKLDGSIQLAALSAAAHFGDHGDVGYINRLYLALGKGARHVALTAWFTTVAGVKANEDKQTKTTKPFIKDSEKSVNLEEGHKTPWYDMKPSKSPDEVVDVLKMALALLKKATNPKEGQDVTHEAMIPELQAIVDKYNVSAVTADGEGGGDEQEPDGQAS